MTIFMYSMGGHSRDSIRLVRMQYPYDDVYFVDDDPTLGALSYAEATDQKGSGAAGMVIAFGDCNLRRKKTTQAMEDGFTMVSVRASTSVVGDNVQFGPGALLSDFTTFTADIRVGRGFQCNLYSFVTHDCEIGDFVTLAPRVSVSGRVHICDDVYVGTGATILQGQPDKPITIGEGAVIGAHALVTKDVPAGTTVIGSPARPLQRNNVC